MLGSGRLDVLKLNAHELRALTGLATLEDAARSLLLAPDAPLRGKHTLLAVTDGAHEVNSPSPPPPPPPPVPERSP